MLLLILLILSHSVFGSELSGDLLKDAPIGSSNYLALVPHEIMVKHILPHILDQRLVVYFEGRVESECYGKTRIYDQHNWEIKHRLPEWFFSFVLYYKNLRSIDKYMNKVVSLYCAYHHVLASFIRTHIEKGSIEPIKAFLKHGGDINMQFEPVGFSYGFFDTLLSRTVFVAGKAYKDIECDYTTYAGCIKIINYLFEKNQNLPIDYTIEGNCSVLHVAVEASDHVSLLKLLLSQGLSLKKVVRGKTAMDLAKENHRPKSLALLMQYEQEQQALDYKRNIILPWKSSNRHCCDNREGLI